MLAECWIINSVIKRSRMVYSRLVVAYHDTSMIKPGLGFFGSPSGLRLRGTRRSHVVVVLAMQFCEFSSSLSCVSALLRF